MVAYKASAVSAFLKSPPADCRAVLVYGPDAGLVSERASALAGLFAKRTQGAAEIVRLDDRDFAEDPARLEMELRTIPMFAARQAVKLAAASRLDVPSLKALLAAASHHPDVRRPAGEQGDCRLAARRACAQGVASRAVGQSSHRRGRQSQA